MRKPAHGFEDLFEGGHFLCRFHVPEDEPVLEDDVTPYLDDNTQLSIEEYRDKLYEVR